MNTNQFLTKLRELLGSNGVLTDPKDTESFNADWRGIFRGNSLAVLRPANVEEVASAVQLCHQYKISIVPQGGNTSLVGGATPSERGDQVILSLSRLNKIRAIDPIDRTIIIEAGVTLEEAQNAAKSAGLYLPIMIASQGSAQIGGIVATNAGGNNTLRYGNTREFVLGLEVVTANGQILRTLRRLRKDNTGYALRQLFIGSEGTLGIITAAVLQLHSLPNSIEVALCALSDLKQALALLNLFNVRNPTALQAFEFISQTGMDLVCTHIHDAQFPLESQAPVYILIELALPQAGNNLRELLESVLEAAFEKEIILDAVIAESEAQRQNLWRLREEQSESQRQAGASIKNDISVPISAIPELIEKASQTCKNLYPGIRIAPFGHIGDGNIHFNLVQPLNDDPKKFKAKGQELMDAVCEVVYTLDGSFSAEHGVGQLKNHMMSSWRGGTELDLMRSIKQILDPENLLNPGKIFP